MFQPLKKTLLILGIMLMSGVMLSSTVFAAESATYRLSNGLTVLIQQDKRFPLVSMRLYVHAGSSYETPKEAGISHLLEHMVFKGTEKRPAGSIAEDIERIGGYINAATSYDYTVYITDLPDAEWKTGLDVLKDMAFNPTISATALEAEKKVVISELKMGEDRPGNRLFKALSASTLAGTPYERPIIGFEDVLNSITRQDVVNYIKKHYQPQSMLLLVCGNVDESALKEEIERLYGPLENTRGYAQPEGLDFHTLQGKGAKITVEKGPWNKVYFGAAFPAPGQGEARSVHLEVLTSLLGDGKTSYLYRKYKYDMQLVDSISVVNYGFERTGMLYLAATLDADKFERFWNEITKDLAGINDIKFSQQELDRVKLNLEDEMYRTKETVSGLASKLGYFAFFNDGGGEKNYLYLLNSTTLNDVHGQLADITFSDSMSVVALLPQEHENPVNAASMQKTLKANWRDGESGSKKADAESMRGKTETVDLGKGRKLVLIPDSTLPYISANLMFTGGDALVGKDQQGLVALTAAMLTKGTGAMSATEYEDYLADRASSINAAPGRQTFSVRFGGPSRFNGEVFKLLRETLEQPAFKEEELARARNNQKAAIKSAEDQPFSLASRKMFPFLFGDHPYGYQQLGEAGYLDSISAADLAAFWGKQKNQPWVLSIAGSFDRDEVIKAAKALPTPKDKGIKVDAPAWGKDKSLEITLQDRNQTHIFLIFPTVPMESADSPALDLLQSVLSGQSGLLFTELRDKQSLGYSVTAFNWSSQKAGAMMFYIGTSPDKAEQAKAGFIEIIDRVKNAPLPEDLLEGGKKGIEGDYYRGHQSLGSRCEEAATLTTLGFPLDTAIKRVEKVQKLTPEQVQKAAQKHLNTDKAYWVEVKP